MRTARCLSLFVLGAFLIATTGCSSQRVSVPPRIDLLGYHTIGLVTFASNSEGTLNKYASQKFLETIQSSQPGVRVLELGNEESLLAELDREKLDYDTMRAIGQNYGVDAVITGVVEVSDVRPSVKVFTMFNGLSANADIDATLTTKLYDALSGATLWTNSAHSKETVAHVGLSAEGPLYFGASDPEKAYGKLVNNLVYTVTRDFRISYAKR